MQHKDSFSSCHPIVSFLYFVLVLGFSMFWMHPIGLCVSLICALFYALFLEGKKVLRFALCFLLPMMLLAAIINPAFNHAGSTILTYLPSGNPLTLESILYGAASAAMLAGVMLWFRCYSIVMSSDKFIYLFGRVIPALSLVLSMTLRFIPRFSAQMRVVREAQRSLHGDVEEKGAREKLKRAIKVVSIMVTWSLESAVETADSMKSRGYGLPNRTAFSIYRITARDKLLLTWLAFCAAYLIYGIAAGYLKWSYFPMLTGARITAQSLCFFAVYLVLCATPLILNGWEGRKWTTSQSKT